MRGFMKRFEFIPGTHRPKLMRNGALFLGLFGLVMMFAFLGGTLPFLPKGGDTIKAEFRTAANVSPKTPVRVRGVKVGKVEKVDRRENGEGVVVTMRINKDNGEIDLRRDARASIYWRTLLGFAFYIELEPGADPQKLGDETIPMERTTAQVELDQVLASVDAPSRSGMQAIFREFDKGFDPEKDSQAGPTIDNLGPAMRQVGPGLDALRGTQRGDLTRVIRNSSRLMGALARNELELGQVITNGNVALGVTAARRADLGQMLQQGPATLRDTRSTMVRLRTTLNELDPIAEDLRPGSRKLDDASAALRPALRELTPLLARTDPMLRSLRPALSRLGAAGTSGVKLMDGLDPTFDRLNDKLIPALDTKSDVTGLKMFQAIGPTFAAVQSSSQQFDSRGHVQRFHAIETSDKAIGAMPCYTDILQGSPTLDCSDLQAIAAAYLGGGPATKKQRLSSRPRPSTTSSGSSRAPSGGGDAATLVKKLADAIGGAL
ncbi:MlaD family protein [Paraconexibacter sp.]|uniref:MlaD family protein n=1 Tax=Paraconexibacter sp. TaxID=2949640 RepID=UPI003569CE5D